MLLTKIIFCCFLNFDDYKLKRICDKLNNFQIFFVSHKLLDNILKIKQSMFTKNSETKIYFLLFKN